MPRPRSFVSLAAAAALLVPGGVLVAFTADAALPKAPGASVPAPLPSKATVGGLVVENSFVSSVGWVKPGQTYPSRIVVKNPTGAAVSGLTVRIPETRGMAWKSATSASGTASLAGGVVTWTVPSIVAGSGAALTLSAEADSFAEEPTIVWRNISSNAAR